MRRITDSYKHNRVQIKTDLQIRNPVFVFILISRLGIKSVILPLTLIVATLLSSCRPQPIDIGVAPAPAKLVITSQVIPNSVMVVGLTRSFSALSPGGNADTIGNSFLDSILVANAIVTVTHPGGTDTLFMITPGIYASVNVLLVDFGYYTIHAKDIETGMEVTATTELLPQERFDTLWPYIADDPISNNVADSVPFIHYELTDLPDAENYYVACFYRKSSDTSAFDINNYFAQGSNELASFNLITKEDFDEYGKLSRDQQLENVGVNDTIACTISHITKGYYEFLSAYKRSSSLFNQLSGEPINYPSNVDDGYGYFATHYPDVRFFELINWH